MVTAARETYDGAVRVATVVLLGLTVGVCAAPPANQPNITWTQTGTNGSSLPIYTGIWAPAAAGTSVTNTATGGVTYGWLDVTAAGNVDNAGTLTLNFPGYTADNRDRMTVTLNSGAGTLTNTGALNLNANGSYGGAIYIYGTLLNDAGGALTVATGTSGGGAVLGTAGATHENRGTLTTTGNQGLTIAGNSTTFQQTLPGTNLNVSQFVLGTSTGSTSGDSIANTLTLTGGSVQGSFTLRRTALTLGAGVTIAGATTFSFEGDNLAGTDAGKPLCSFTGDVPANVTLFLPQTLTGSNGSFLQTPGSVANRGTVTLRSNGGYVPNGAYALLQLLGGGTLTNYGVLNFQVGPHYSASGNEVADLDGNLINAAGGIINVTEITGANSGDKSGRLVKSGGVYSNLGTVALTGTVKFQTDGSSFTNGTGGVINGTAQSSATASTMLGTATLDNASGAIEAVGGTATYTLTVSNALSATTKSGANTLLAGTYRVTGGSAATALSLGAFGAAGTITTLGAASGSAAVVTLDGANAAFTQIETASGNGSLATINATGRLNVNGGKTFTTAAALSDAGMVSIGSSSFLKLGSAGSGTLNLASGGTVGGTGTVQGNISAAGSGIVSPGSSIGTLTTSGNLAFSGTANALAVEFDSTLSDLISVGGLLSLGTGATTLNLTPLSGTILPLTGTTYTIASYGTQTGTFSSILGPSRYQYFLNYGSGTNSSITLLVVPEPATAGLLALAAALALRRRRA